MHSKISIIPYPFTITMAEYMNIIGRVNFTLAINSTAYGGETSISIVPRNVLDSCRDHFA